MVGVVEDQLHQRGVFAQREAEHGESACHGHGQSGLCAITCQPGEQQVSVLIIVVGDSLGVVVCFHEVILKNGMHRLVAVLSRHNLFGFDGRGAERPYSLLHIRADRIKRYGQRVEHRPRVVAHVADAVQSRLQLLNGYAQLGIIGHAGFLIEVGVEPTDVVIGLRQPFAGGTAGMFAGQFAAAHNLHTSPAQSDEGHQRLWHQGCALSHGYRLFVAGQVVHLEHHHACIRFLCGPVVAFHHQGGKAQSR